MTLVSDCLGLSLWRVAFKTILNNITKIPVAFKPELQIKFGAYAL